MGQFASNILLLIGGFALTIICGYPIAQHIKARSSISKAVVSFAFGFGVIALTGIIGSLIGAYFFVLPAIVVGLLILIFVSGFKKNSIKLGEGIRNLRVDPVLCLFGALAALLLLYLFSQIIMWTAGDGTFHSSVIRLIVEGEKVPLRFTPKSGEGYAFYPKLFHYYVAFLVNFFGSDIIQTMKIIPILIVMMISFAIYAIAKELDLTDPIPLFAFMVSFALWKHLYPLIWMGYAQLSADFFLTALIISLYLESKSGFRGYSVFLFIFLYLSHPRHFLYSIPLVVWILISKIQGPTFRNFILSLLISIGAISLLLIILGRLGFPHYPAYITRLATGVESPIEFMFLWNLGLLFIFGAYISIIRRTPEDWLLLLIFFSWLSIALLIDSSIFRIDIPDKRSYSKLFIPVSIFTAIFFNKVTPGIRNRVKIYLVGADTFLLFSFLIISAFINAPLLGWVMAEADYNAMKTLEGKTGICVNVDPTGRWVYPVAGVKVTNSRGAKILNNSELEQLIWHPSSTETYRLLDNLKDQYGSVYIFISKRTREHPGYLLFGLTYPEINEREFIESERYSIIYDEGALILQYKSKLEGSR